MKTSRISLLFLFFIIGFAGVLSTVHAQGFDSISHPNDVTVEQGGEVSITWVVNIDSVGSNPTYDVHRDGTKFIPGFTWSLNGTVGTIKINPPTDIDVGIYNINITVYDGLGNNISDDVNMTVTEPSDPSKVWVYIVAGGVIGAIFLFMYFNKRRLTKQVESSL